MKSSRRVKRTSRRGGEGGDVDGARDSPWKRAKGGGVGACGEGGDGVDEERDNRGGAVAHGDTLQGRVDAVIGCAQRRRVLAD